MEVSRRTTVKRVLAPVCLLIGLAVAGAVLADTPAGEPVMDGVHFLHGNHKAPLSKIGIDVENPDHCQKCHSLNDKGQVMAPAAQGHTPCLQSGCHGSDFMLISAKTKQAKPQEFLKASAFCLGCHPTVPWAWKKPATLVISAWHNQREHHVEMPHYVHTQMTKKDGTKIGCRDCHMVNEKFELAVGTPGHAQCAQSGCHTPTDYPEHTMNKCGACHASGSRDNFLRAALRSHPEIKIDPKKDIDGSRPGSDVRVCSSQGEDQYKKKTGRKVPCFRHETPGHRMTNDKKDVQCVTCHFIVTQKAGWTKSRSFENVVDLHLNKIIGNAFNDSHDMQHEACSGANSCHRHEQAVRINSPDSNCTLCHATRTKNEPF